MQVVPGQRIRSLSASRLKAFLAHLYRRGGEPHFYTPFFMRFFNLPDPEASRVLRELQEDRFFRFLKTDEDCCDLWVVGESGHRLLATSIRARVSHAKGDEAVASLVQTARVINAERGDFVVQRLVAFGSWVKGKPDIGDVDIVSFVVRRKGADWENSALPTKQRLKRSNRLISLHVPSDLELVDRALEIYSFDLETGKEDLSRIALNLGGEVGVGKRPYDRPSQIDNFNDRLLRPIPLAPAWFPRLLPGTDRPFDPADVRGVWMPTPYSTRGVLEALQSHLSMVFLHQWANGAPLDVIRRLHSIEEWPERSFEPLAGAIRHELLVDAGERDWLPEAVRSYAAANQRLLELPQLERVAAAYPVVAPRVQAAFNRVRLSEKPGNRGSLRSIIANVLSGTPEGINARFRLKRKPGRPALFGLTFLEDDMLTPVGRFRSSFAANLAHLEADIACPWVRTLEKAMPEWLAIDVGLDCHWGGVFDTDGPATLTPLSSIEPLVPWHSGYRLREPKPEERWFSGREEQLRFDMQGQPNVRDRPRRHVARYQAIENHLGAWIFGHAGFFAGMTVSFSWQTEPNSLKPSLWLERLAMRNAMLLTEA